MHKLPELEKLLTPKANFVDRFFSDIDKIPIPNPPDREIYGGIEERDPIEYFVEPDDYYNLNKMIKPITTPFYAEYSFSEQLLNNESSRKSIYDKIRNEILLHEQKQTFQFLTEVASNTKKGQLYNLSDSSPQPIAYQFVGVLELPSLITDIVVDFDDYYSTVDYFIKDPYKDKDDINYWILKEGKFRGKDFYMTSFFSEYETIVRIFGLNKYAKTRLLFDKTVNCEIEDPSNRMPFHQKIKINLNYSWLCLDTSVVAGGVVDDKIK